MIGSICSSKSDRLNSIFKQKALVTLVPPGIHIDWSADERRIAAPAPAAARAAVRGSPGGHSRPLCFWCCTRSRIIVNQSIRNDDGGLSLDWYWLAYSNLRNYQAILNTLLIAAGSALFAIGVGTLLAWAVVRTDMPGRRLIELASIIPFISTPLVGALAWILLASPQTGLINQAWRYLGAAGSVVDIYSIWGIIFVEAVYETPLVFLLVSGALRSMDPTLEEAARSAGAGMVRTALRITLPLVLPAILAGGLLVFILAAEQFAVPAVLGTPGKIRVLTTSIFEAQSVYPARDGLAAALSGILMVIALGGLWLHKRLLGRPLLRHRQGQERADAPGPARRLALCAAGHLLPLSGAGGGAAALDHLPELDPQDLDRRIPLGAVHSRQLPGGAVRLSGRPARHRQQPAAGGRSGRSPPSCSAP